MNYQETKILLNATIAERQICHLELFFYVLLSAICYQLSFFPVSIYVSWIFSLMFIFCGMQIGSCYYEIGHLGELVYFRKQDLATMISQPQPKENTNDH